MCSGCGVGKADRPPIRKRERASKRERARERQKKWREGGVRETTTGRHEGGADMGTRQEGE